MKPRTRIATMFRSSGAAQNDSVRAAATPAFSRDAKGIGARSNGRLRATFAVLALAIAAFALTAASASAAPPSTTPPEISNVSYASAHVTGIVTTDGSGLLGVTNYAFQYSTDQTNWSPGPSGSLNGSTTKKVEGDIHVPKGGTKYYVRLVANFLIQPAVPSPEPNPSFTTLAVEPPTLPGAVAASNVFSTSATATGKVKRPANADPAFDVSACRFEYVNDTDFTATGFASATTVPCEPATPFTTPGGETEVSAPLTGLDPSTTYHLRLAAENAAPGAATTKEAAPFTTNAKVTALPTVVATGDATNVDKRTALASGEVERPAGADPALDVSCRFEYVTDQQFTEHGFENAGQAPCLGPNEAQSLTVAATAGQFRLTYGGQTTPDLPFNATAGQVQGALRSMGVEVLVNGGPGDGAGSTPYRITFVGGLGEQDVAEIVATNGTTPLAGTANVTTLTTGTTAFKALNDPPANQPKDIRAELSGLEPGTTYHLRLTAENGAGTVSKDAASTFTTIAITPPTLTLDSVTEVGYTSFRVTGTADPGNQGVIPQFEFSPAGTEEWVANPSGRFEPIGAGSSPQQVSFTFPCDVIAGICDSAPLKPGTTYKVRMTALDSEVFSRFNSPEPYLEFTTKGTSTPPSATFSVSGVAANSAHFSANVDTHAPAGPLNAEAKAAYKTDWHFECTPECPPQGVLSGTVQAEEGAKAISADIIHLQPNTYYEVKLIAHNELETVETPVQTFQTPLVAPTVIPAPGGSDGQGGYFLEGSINSNNTKVTSCRFEYGTTATYPNTYEAPCLPSPSGPNEVQLINVEATEGQFKLSFRGQTTVDLPFNATPAEVQTALRALSQIGSTGVNVSGTAGAYKVTFAGGGLAGANVEPLKSADGTTPLGGGAGVSVSTESEGGTSHPVSVETHLEALTIGSTYHFRIFVTGAGGAVSTVDRTFIPELAEKEICANEQLRKENSSLELPECRAYEMTTYPSKEGKAALFRGNSGGDAVLYASLAPNLANSGQGGGAIDWYVATRTAAGWQTIPDLNGPSGSFYGPPEEILAVQAETPLAYSSDLMSSVWGLRKKVDPVPYGEYQPYGPYLRRPDGRFALVGVGSIDVSDNQPGSLQASDDLSHLVLFSHSDRETFWGQGVYEFVGTGNDQPRRVDVDNTGEPIPGCHPAPAGTGGGPLGRSDAVSGDGRIIVVSACNGSIWARVDGTTSYDLSASLCTRPDCNAPANATYQAAAKDGSRVYFTTTQQLVNGDTDETKDLYACDIPTTPQAPVGEANPCSALREVSAGSAGNAQVQQVFTVSADGSTAYFTAKGVLADNEDALGEEALAGDENLYVWRTDAAHPAGQTNFVARLDPNDLVDPVNGVGLRTTPDGRYVVFTTANRLLDTDTDTARDVYRYDAVSGEMVRVSTAVSGAGGNGAFDASGASISDDGKLVVFETNEPLSPLDGNGEPDAYLWNDGHALGSVAPLLPGFTAGQKTPGRVSIDGSGHDIYIDTAARLNPTDVDFQNDVYDARINGGFPQPQEGCTGESCQPGVSNPPPSRPLGSQGAGPGNPTPPKPCPKGKVKKHGKCVKKSHKKHSGRKHHGKKASHKQGGGK